MTSGFDCLLGNKIFPLGESEVKAIVVTGIIVVYILHNGTITVVFTFLISLLFLFDQLYVS